MRKQKFCTPEEIYRKRASMPDFCRLEDLSGSFVLCAISLEDPQFLKHKGCDIRAVWRSVQNYLRDRTPLRGNSTITQQLVKNLYFSFERKLSRKLTELIRAIQFERKLTKQQILELYLNVVFFGNGHYGIHDAARFYFGKLPDKLTLNQSFFLASILPVPSTCNPLYCPEKFVQYRNRRISVLPAVDEEIFEEITRHGVDCLDEEFCAEPSAETERYNACIPMFNEKFGINGEYPLVLSGPAAAPV